MMANLNGSSTSATNTQAMEKQKSVEYEATTTTTTNTMTTSGLDELQKVNDFFEANSSAIERWLKEKASDEVINRLHSITRNKDKAAEQHRSSVTSELYQQWLSSSMKVRSWKNKIIYLIPP
jgi:hypothetical protein